MDFEKLGKKNKGEDVISKLPDHVLSHILSHLKIKEAVKTSILSSRWKNLWTFVHNLCFEECTFSHTEESSSSDRKKCFVEFVERVLSLCQSKDIHDFQLNYYEDLEDSDLPPISEWICYAAEHNVRVLTLKIDIGYERMHIIRIPQTVITCKTLLKLELCSETCDFAFDIVDSVASFPSLKILCIDVGNPDGNQMRKLFRSCPVLEELTINGDFESTGKELTFDITVPTLKKLNIYIPINHIDHVSAHKFVVRTRNLEYLYIEDDSFACFVVDETPFLNSTNLEYGQGVTQIYSDLSRNEANRAIELLTAVKKTKSLSFSIPIMGVLIEAFDGKFPTFPNLVYLNLVIDRDFGWKVLPHFLNNSPNLEVLILNEEQYFEDNDIDTCFWFEPESVPHCLLAHVKTIQIKSMMGELDELEVVKYLLENSKVLERFTVEIVVNNPKRKQTIQHQISMFPRSSTICTMNFI